MTPPDQELGCRMCSLVIHKMRSGCCSAGGSRMNLFLVFLVCNLIEVWYEGVFFSGSGRYSYPRMYSYALRVRFWVTLKLLLCVVFRTFRMFLVSWQKWEKPYFWSTVYDAALFVEILWFQEIIQGQLLGSCNIMSLQGYTDIAFDTIMFVVSLCTIFIVPVYGRAMLAPTCSIMMRRIGGFNWWIQWNIFIQKTVWLWISDVF